MLNNVKLLKLLESGNRDDICIALEIIKKWCSEQRTNWVTQYKLIMCNSSKENRYLVFNIAFYQSLEHGNT